MGIAGKTVIVGVTGGIAAYKAAELVRLLVKAGASVHVVMTKAAEQFIGAVTFQALTRHHVHCSVFTDEKEGQIAHIDLADHADLIVIAPATADTLARLAAGRADDMLTAVVLAARCPVLVAPAMNSNMYQHPAVQHNIKLLADYGYHFIGPESGKLACGWTGKGRLVAPEAIAARATEFFMEQQEKDAPLRGKKILVTAGPTREGLDPVRFFSNLSTGKMGYAIAEQAARLGADVTLISGPVQLDAPPNVTIVRVVSALEMRAAVLRDYQNVDAVIQSAAVADYRPEEAHAQKIKKQDGPLLVRLVRNPDILKELGLKKEKQILIGFAAETENLEANAKRKLETKHLDLLVANLAADGFATDTNKVTFYFANGRYEPHQRLPKHEVASRICAALAALFEESECQ
ncbi:bifunctional phosphopantothenoylcysteine decarboxylase/phosphopantothenate--cysteine ligase CoaBC [Sporolactobacillus spathodeae]|uniref:Coenzyme A biosynthesis bifunctional protein CoaBC n=1 Tax=Sporolactobacillus spathodeae TaxID=1465502 RepID=A0ABS2Q9G1_9BACL|nr:bifunctional phosphopantothenoylcysteine decarboxylase/phosphopantothenate--cysteine ligase CoaBC [Sporolactobacillus spathodeae]MBM7658256.1 phosphopantothenoylcysteine decarboxylase/phosphopantothenate--cysteine ligase [Sporolactobacillus spathodeae]